LTDLLLILLAPLAATLIQLAISRSREYGADETGARIVGNPEALARALEKLEMASSVRPLPVNPAVAHMFIVNPLKGVNFSGLFSTHPPLQERIRRLRAMSLARIY
jgi:heat shock protein HtpX